jgi:cell division septum initiation protein DivIVA
VIVDIVGRLQQIQDLLKEAKTRPFSTSAVVNRDDVLELLEAAVNELPQEIKQARWIVKDREELLAKARNDGEGIVLRAHEERARLVSEEEVFRAANVEAEQILAEAREQARQLRLEAEDYVDAKLAQYEIALGKTYSELERSIAQVRRGRDKLRGVSPAEEEFGTGEVYEDER